MSKNRGRKKHTKKGSTKNNNKKIKNYFEKSIPKKDQQKITTKKLKTILKVESYCATAWTGWKIMQHKKKTFTMK